MALITIPFFTGAIGYVTNWTGVLMLFYPVHFRGVPRQDAASALARLLPRKIQQIPGVMIGGIGWQGIVPSRAAKMGSLAVDSGIAKLGTPTEFWQQLEPDKMADQIVETHRDDMRAHRRSDHGARASAPVVGPAAGGQGDGARPRAAADCPEIVHELTEQIGTNIDQLVDVKLMVIRRFEAQPELANRIFLDMGQTELKFIQNFGFFFGFALGIPVAADHALRHRLVAAADPRRDRRLRHQLARAVDDLRAARARTGSGRS